MTREQVILYALKLIFAGAASFVSLLYLARTKSVAWTCIIIGFLFRYLGILTELFSDLGFFSSESFYIFGISIFQIAASVVPNLFFIVGFILLLNKR